MSEPLDLSASIRANTAAVQALTALLQREVNLSERRVAPEVIDLAAFPLPAEEVAEAPVAAPTVEDVRKAAVALAKVDREKLSKLVAKFEATSAAAIKPERYALFIVECGNEARGA